MKEVLTMGCNKIYKYQPFSMHAIDNLSNNQIWFSSPMQLNDPLEGKLPYRLIEPGENEWVEIHKKFTTNQYPNIDYKEIIKHTIPDNDQKHLIKMVAKNKLADLIYRKKKVACFSTNLNIFLMWSHYADGHRGFCLEFDRTVFPFSIAESIIYSDEYFGFKIDDILSGNIPDPDKMMKLKLPRWDYEKELRIVYDNETNDVTDVKNYLSKALTGIYCGATMPWDHKRLLFSIVRTQMPQTIIYGLDNINEENGFSIGTIEQLKSSEIGYTPNLFMRYKEGEVSIL